MNKKKLKELNDYINKSYGTTDGLIVHVNTGEIMPRHGKPRPKPKPHPR